MGAAVSEPRRTIDGRAYKHFMPRLGGMARVELREIRSAVGREGSKALLTYIACAVVLVSGVHVTVKTWANRERGTVVLPVADRLPWVDDRVVMSLSLYWYLFVVALGATGWLLSGQVTKRWLRAYVVVGLVISMLLIITIGRNANFDQAAATARADARRLLQAVGPEGQAVEGALLQRLCDEGNLPDQDCRTPDGRRPSDLGVVGTGSDSDRPDGGDGADDRTREEVVGAAKLDPCLPGWTLNAFDQWLEDASFDRKIAALSALASCQIGALDPGSETPDPEQIEVVVVEATTTTTVDERGEPAEAASPAPPPAATTTSTAPPDDATGSATGDGVDVPADVDTADVLGAAAVTEVLRVQRSEVRAHEAIVRGADEILSFASGPSHFAEFRFSAIAWLVLLAAALFWYRQLEIRAGAHRLGPVDVQFEPVGGADSIPAGEEGARRLPTTPAEALFKEAVIRNVPEPGAVPGSGALAPVGDLVAQSDLPNKSMAGAVIELLQTVFATKGGFTVTCSIRTANGRHSAFVRLRDTRTGNHLASRVTEGDSPEDAARLAGFWIAGWIIWRSAYVPSWAQWSEDDAASCINTGWEQTNDLVLSMTGEFADDENGLHTVNAMILAQRAYAHQLSATKGRNHLAALEDFARAVHRRPRYPVARYRRGAVLGTMMLLGGSVDDARGVSPPGGPDGGGGDADPAAETEDALQTPTVAAPTASRLHYLFGDLILGDDRNLGDDTRAQLHDWCTAMAGDASAEFDQEMRRVMLLKVAEWSTENRAALRWRWLARLRPSERFFWKSFAKGDLGRDWLRLLTLERCIAAERLEVLNDECPDLGRRGTPTRYERFSDWRLRRALERVERRALEPDSHWQISYNLGCLYAIRSALSDVDEVACREAALRWLERSHDRPASAQLVRNWVEVDGDLKQLRTVPEFERWKARLPQLTGAGTIPQ